MRLIRRRKRRRRRIGLNTFWKLQNLFPLRASKSAFFGEALNTQMNLIFLYEHPIMITLAWSLSLCIEANNYQFGLIVLSWPKKISSNLKRLLIYLCKLFKEAKRVKSWSIRGAFKGSKSKNKSMTKNGHGTSREEIVEVKRMKLKRIINQFKLFFSLIISFTFLKVFWVWE